MTTSKIPSRLTISDIPTEYIEAFLNLCDGMELSRGQLLILLLSERGLIKDSINSVFHDEDAKSEWLELLINRIFQYVNSDN